MRLTLLILVALLSGAGVAAAAAIRTSSTAVTSGAFDLEFPTVRGPHGVRFSLFPSCAAHASALDAAFGTLSDGSSLAHVYSGPLNCRLSPGLRHAGVRARWGSDLALNLTLAQVGSTHVSHEQVAPHCAITVKTRRYVVTGTVAVAIHPGALGTYRSLPRRVTEDSSDFPRCVFKGVASGSGAGFGAIYVGTSARSQASGTTTTGATTTTGTTTTTTGTTTTGASTTVVPPTGTTPDVVSLNAHRTHASFSALTGVGVSTGGLVSVTETLHDLDVPHVHDLLLLSVLRGAHISFPADLGSASIDLRTPLVSGSLTYTSTGLCRHKGTVGTKGSLTGSVSVKDPVTGTVTISAAELGGRAALSYLGADASGECN